MPKMMDLFKIIEDNQIYAPRDQEVFKHNLIIIGKCAESHLATPLIVGMLVFYNLLQQKKKIYSKF